MKRIFIMSVFAFAIGCSTKVSVLTVRQALQRAEVERNVRVKVAGYFFSHFEGDSLEWRAGDAGIGISLAAPTNERPASTHFAKWKAYHQKYVVVSGILRRGPFLGGGPAGLLPDCVYLEVESVEEG